VCDSVCFSLPQCVCVCFSVRVCVCVFLAELGEQWTVGINNVHFPHDYVWSFTLTFMGEAAGSAV